MEHESGNAREPEGGPATARIGPASVLLWTLGIGLGSGLLELAVFLLKCHYLDPRNYNLSRQYPWMFPVAGLLVVALPGLLLTLAVIAFPRRISARLALGTLLFPAFLGLLFRAPIATAACLILAFGLALQVSRLAASRLRAFNRLVVRGLAAMGVFLAAGMLFTFAAQMRKPLATAAKPGQAAGSKNVILIVLDTVRAGSLSLYGYNRETTPNLSRWAAKGVRFDHAFATAPWTAPSHASMFTGKASRELSIGWNKPLDGDSPTLAEYLGGRGYATAGFVANTTYCSYETGLDRGFAHYEDYDVSAKSILLCSSLVQRALNFVHKHPTLAHRLGEGESANAHRKSAARIRGDFLGWLDRQEQTRPFFAFLNFFDAHHPYFTPEPMEDLPFGREPESPADSWMLRTWWDLDKRKLEPRSVELARDAYDRCIAYLDREVGRLLDDLDRRGVLQETMVIVTADHGEHLGERRLFGHGCSLYLPELHVPLLVIEPGSQVGGRTVAEPVSLRDLPATVVDRLGLAAGAPFSGRTLARTWTSPAPASATSFEPLLSEIDAPFEADPNHGESPVCRGPLTSLVDGNLHYIQNGDGREELYNLEADPAEATNLAEAPELANALARFRSHLE
ncbi:sulfatase-like hydrolase/transferase [Singulisphaera sp. PoT]|uniref:sulfatase-like hydrolase/transferase n=1 Tax=Singulisphaera sp. PoT TaxID=3411797 RepID=UPI003BF4ED95